MDFTQTVITSGIVAAVISGFITHFSSTKLDIQQRTMEIRKELYTKTINQIALFITTVSDQESDDARDNLIKYFREIQLWGSDEVVISFKNLLDLMSPENALKVKERNESYKEFILAMRKDMLGDSCLTENEIDIRGIIKK